MPRKLALALVAPLLIVSACATEAPQAAVEVQTGAVAVDALRAAPDAVVDAGTVAFEMTISINGGEQAFELTAAGAVDSAAERMSMEMDLGDMLSGLAEASGETLPAGMDEPMRIVVDGTSVYLRMPMLDSLTGSSGWLSASPEELGQGGSAGSLGLGTGAYDPARLLEVLRGVSDDVVAAGRDEVRGVPTTRYTATVSLAKALDQAPADQRAALQAQLDQLGSGDVEVPVEVWVDADGLPRRMTMSLAGLANTADLGAGTAMEMRMEFFDYGQPQTIDVPSPDEVTPMSDVLGRVGGTLGGGLS